MDICLKVNVLFVCHDSSFQKKTLTFAFCKVNGVKFDNIIQFWRARKIKLRELALKPLEGLITVETAQ